MVISYIFDQKLQNIIERSIRTAAYVYIAEKSLVINVDKVH